MVQTSSNPDLADKNLELVRALYPTIEVHDVDRRFGIRTSASEGVVVCDAVHLDELPADVGSECIFATQVLPRAILGRLQAVVAIVTSYEDPSSHLAIVCKSKGIPLVSLGEQGFAEIESYLKGRGGSWRDCAVDSFAGTVMFGTFELREADVEGSRRSALSFLREKHSIDIHANADSAQDIRAAVAQGFRRCWPRSESLLYDSDTFSHFNALLLEPGNSRARRMFIRGHSASISALFREAGGTRIGFRLLDPPSHEFLPGADEVEQVERLADALGRSTEETQALLRRHRETNPMIGHRGARLLLTNRGLLEAQATSLIEAWNATAAGSRPPSVDILIPFVMVPAELRALKSAILQIVSDLCGDQLPPLRFGCMIEVPSLLLCPEKIAALADFVSFGTNDLVALTYGISRGDSYERYLLEYLQIGILEEDPFLVLPAPIVRQICDFSGRLRGANPRVEIDLCGEQALATDLSLLIRSGALDSVSIGTACLPQLFTSLLRNDAGIIV